jgi:hypothetical protein
MATSRRPLPTEFPVVWLPFTNSVKPYTGPNPADRGADQFLDFRDKTFALVQDTRFVSALDTHLYRQLARPTRVLELPNDFGQRLFDAFLEELRACTRAAEVTQATFSAATSADDARKEKKAQLSKFSTTLGSLKDVIGEVPWLKTGIGLFKELVDYHK